MNKISKMLLVSTSFAPILITFSFVKYLSGEKIYKLWPYAVVIIGLVIICLCLLYYSKNYIQEEAFTVTSISTADGEVVGFIIAYMLPLLSLTIPVIDIRVIYFIALMFFIVIWTTNSYHINPLLSLVGYHFYEVSCDDNVTYLLLTKKELRKTTTVSTVVHLTEYMILDVEGK